MFMTQALGGHIGEVFLCTTWKAIFKAGRDERAKN